MPIITLTRCPVCGSIDIKKAFDAVDHFSSGEAFPLFDCTHCGFRFTNDFPSEDTIGRYYDSPGYISHSDTREGLSNKLYHLARRVMLRRKVRLVSNHTANKPVRLLDMGCGTGYFLHAAKEKGFIVSGIEKDEKAREHAATRFGLDVKNEKSFWNMQTGLFDAVTLWHVLEHLEKLNESIDKIKNILTDDGIALIAVPNHHSHDAAFYKDYWAAYDVPRHLWHFSPASIENLLARHGMTIVKRYPMPLDAFYISLLSERYKGSAPPVQYGRASLIGLAGFAGSLVHVKHASSIVYIVRKT